MKRNVLRFVILFVLLFSLSLGLAGCSGSESTGYEVIARLDDEQFTVAFRSGDPTCEIVSAAIEEMAAEGLLSRLSTQYLGADYSCLAGTAGAMSALTVDIPAGKRLLVGVQNGAAPLCWKDDSGNFTGLIPDMVQSLAEKTGWEIVYIEITSDDVSVELASGNVDCVWLPASYAPDAKFSLSPSWMENSHMLIVRRGSGLNKIRDLKKRNIGVTDNTAENALKNNSKIYDSVTIWRYNDIRSCFTALAVGDCDAIVIDSIVSSNYLT